MPIYQVTSDDTATPNEIYDAANVFIAIGIHRDFGGTFFFVIGTPTYRCKRRELVITYERDDLTGDELPAAIVETVEELLSREDIPWDDEDTPLRLR